LFLFLFFFFLFLFLFFFLLLLLLNLSPVVWCASAMTTASARRSTVNAERTFVVSFPFFLASGALHIEDVLELYVSGDPLGIRGRLGLFYARATFKRAREVEAAAAAISAERLRPWVWATGPFLV